MNKIILVCKRKENKDKLSLVAMQFIQRRVWELIYYTFYTDSSWKEGFFFMDLIISEYINIRPWALWLYRLDGFPVTISNKLYDSWPSMIFFVIILFILSLRPKKVQKSLKLKLLQNLRWNTYNHNSGQKMLACSRRSTLNKRLF